MPENELPVEIQAEAKKEFSHFEQSTHMMLDQYSFVHVQIVVANHHILI